MKSKKPYSPNDWIDVLHTEYPDNVTYEDFNEYCIQNWHLNSSHAFLFRAQHNITGKIKEYAYQRPVPAQKKLIDLVINNYTVTVVDEDSVSVVSAKPGMLND